MASGAEEGRGLPLQLPGGGNRNMRGGMQMSGFPGPHPAGLLESPGMREFAMAGLHASLGGSYPAAGHHPSPPMPLGIPEHLYTRPLSISSGQRGMSAPPAYGAYPPEDQSAARAAMRHKGTMREMMDTPSEDPPRKRGKHLMERLLWNGSFLRCPGKNCQGIVERTTEPRHGEMLDCSVRGCNRKLFYCAYCHRAYVIVTEPDWTLGEHGLEICHMADKEAKRRIVEEACEKYRREHPGSKRYPPWQRKEIEDILLIREEPGFLTYRIPIWSEQELDTMGEFLGSCMCQQENVDSNNTRASPPATVPQRRSDIPRLVTDVLQRLHDIQTERFKERNQDADSSASSVNTAATRIGNGGFRMTSPPPINMAPTPSSMAAAVAQATAARSGGTPGNEALSLLMSAAMAHAQKFNAP